MTLDQLRYLDIIITYGSISKAAEHCYLSTSTLARQISCLEAEIGFPVFEKTSVGVKLTAQGSLFYNQTKRILPIYENALLNARKLTSSSMTVRIGISSVLNHIIAEVCSSLAEQMPNVAFEFVPCPSLGVIEDYLLENKIDAMILSDLENLDDRFFVKPFFYAFNSVAVPLSSPLASHNQLCMKDLNGESLLLTAFENKHIITLKKELATKCPDARIIIFDDPEVAHVEAIRNHCLISSISLFSPSYGLKNIPLKDAPQIRMGFCCLKENSVKYAEVLERCLTFFSTYDTGDNAIFISD